MGKVERLVGEYNAASRVEEVFREFRCGSSICMFGRSGGMMTNGPCRHHQMSRDEMRREFMRFTKAIADCFYGGKAKGGKGSV